MEKAPNSKASRKLVICCDGTSNQFARDRTNVLKLAFAALNDPARQLLYYHPGVGTMAPPGVFTGIGQKVIQTVGLAFGYGLKADIRDAYTFLINHYRPDDEVYIFGFSRGAYTARALVALIAEYGLLAPGSDALVPYAIRLLWSFHGASAAKKAAAFKLAGEFKNSLSTGKCKVRFLGVWDTVSSVGWIANPLSLPNTSVLPGVDSIRHAVSIDERRAFFRTNLVKADSARDIQEVWFVGDHCDIGGGHPELVSGLSKIPLNWMISEAKKAGMAFDDARIGTILGQTSGDYAKPDPNAPMHDAMWPIWWLAEFTPKKHWDHVTGRTQFRANLFRRRHFSSAPVIDDSAWERANDYAKRLPKDAVRRSSIYH
ncbi:DUF2235 domain-containing protein [Sphingomonas sp.]|uniref:DUF2235 domain-containing protein n=1 Tax=Sphingomonas sp. TaxID=28214 RepID=UPI0038A6DD7F